MQGKIISIVALIIVWGAVITLTVITMDVIVALVAIACAYYLSKPMFTHPPSSD